MQAHYIAQSGDGGAGVEKMSFGERDLWSLGLKLTKRRQAREKACGRGFGVFEDPYFAQHGGQHCGQFEYQGLAGDGTAGGVDVVVKVFEAEVEAEEYTRRYWRLHTHSPLPVDFWTLEPRVTPEGDEGDEDVSTLRMLRWHPDSQSLGLLPPSTVMTTELAQHQHMLLWSTGRTFVRLVVSSPASVDSTSTSALAARLRGLTVDRIERTVPTTAAVSVRRIVVAMLDAVGEAEDVLGARLHNGLGAARDAWAEVWAPPTPAVPEQQPVTRENLTTLLADDELLSGQLPASALIGRALRAAGITIPVERREAAGPADGAQWLTWICLVLVGAIGMLSVSDAIESVGARRRGGSV